MNCTSTQSNSMLQVQPAGTFTWRRLSPPFYSRAAPPPLHPRPTKKISFFHICMHTQTQVSTLYYYYRNIDMAHVNIIILFACSDVGFIPLRHVGILWHFAIRSLLKKSSVRHMQTSRKKDFKPNSPNMFPMQRAPCLLRGAS